MIRYKSRQNTKGDRALITGAFNRYTDLAPGVQEPVALRQRSRDKGFRLSHSLLQFYPLLRCRHMTLRSAALWL